MPRVTYTTAVGPGVSGEPAETFAATVDRVLADPRGWRKYGYKFVRTEKRPSLLIRLETAETATRKCGVSGFSCWREKPNDIIMNLANWMGGSKSELPLDKYRTYVVSHEVGHSLGLDHQKCPIAECARRGMTSCPAPVMMQMTRGPGHVWPCTESEWPLDPDWVEEDPRRLRGFTQALKEPTLALLWAAVAVVVILIVCLVWILAGKKSLRGRGKNITAAAVGA